MKAKRIVVWFLTLTACASQPLSKEDFFSFRQKFESLKINQPFADAVKSLGSPTAKKTSVNDHLTYASFRYDIGQEVFPSLFVIASDESGNVAALIYYPHSPNGDGDVENYLQRMNFQFKLSQLVDQCSHHINDAYYYSQNEGIIIKYQMINKAVSFIYRARRPLIDKEINEITTCPNGKSTSADPTKK